MTERSAEVGAADTFFDHDDPGYDGRLQVDCVMEVCLHNPISAIFFRGMAYTENDRVSSSQWIYLMVKTPRRVVLRCISKDHGSVFW